MLKQVLTGASVLVMMLVSHLPAQAQTRASAPNPSGQVAQKPQGQPALQVRISPQELQKFANAVEQLLVIEREAQQQMIQAIQQEGFTATRFREILSAQPSTPVTDEERQKFGQALTKVAAIEQQAEPKMKKAVEDQGLELQRFNQIMAAAQQNPDLRQQVQKLIKS